MKKTNVHNGLGNNVDSNGTLEAPEKSAPSMAIDAPIDLQSMLSEYKEPAKIDIPESVEPESTSENWVGNPNYFQSGKKAGQLKPKAAQKAKVAFAQDNGISEIGGDLISGTLFLTLMDLMFPLLISFLNNKFSKKKIKSEDLQLTEKQKNMLDPVAERVAAQLKLQASPTTVLCISMGGIYAMNFAALKYASK